jgi:hypothetical protein
MADFLCLKINQIRSPETDVKISESVAVHSSGVMLFIYSMAAG